MPGLAPLGTAIAMGADRFHHADAYLHPSEAYWAPVVALVQSGLAAVDGGS